MNKLSTEEKEAHAKGMEKFLNHINALLLFPAYGDAAEIIQVAYGVKIEDAYFYFDFPYSKSADNLNEELTNNKFIKGIDIKVHDAFFEIQKRGENGFIYFEYSFNSKSQSFILTESKTNIPISKELAQNYLPIVHSAWSKESLFLKKVEVKKIKDAEEQILILCQWPKQIFDNLPKTEINKDNNVLLCTFRVDVRKIKVDTDLVNNLYEKIFYFLTTYFVSPIAEKIIQERRKSEIYAYQHTIGNLELDSYINKLEDLQNGKELKNTQGMFKSFVSRLRTLRLMHFSLFQIESIHADIPVDIKRTFPLSNKTITEIVKTLIAEYNINDVENFFEIDQNLENLDFIPSTGTSKEPSTELYDILLILWNIWQNAAAQAIGRDTKKVYISAKIKNDRLCISFRNRGRMFDEYLNYIKGTKMQYPSLNSNPNKKYRGIEIVKDKCTNQDRKWKFDADIVQNDEKKWDTIVSVTF